MEKKYYIFQKEAYSIYPQVDCLSVFQAQQISSWKIFSGIKPKLSFRLKKKAKDNNGESNNGEVWPALVLPLPFLQVCL